VGAAHAGACRSATAESVLASWADGAEAVLADSAYSRHVYGDTGSGTSATTKGHKACQPAESAAVVAVVADPAGGQAVAAPVAAPVLRGSVSVVGHQSGEQNVHWVTNLPPLVEHHVGQIRHISAARPAAR
jgi:hypothetical protein